MPYVSAIRKVLDQLNICQNGFAVVAVHAVAHRDEATCTGLLGAGVVAQKL